MTFLSQKGPIILLRIEFYFHIQDKNTASAETKCIGEIGKRYCHVGFHSGSICLKIVLCIELKRVFQLYIAEEMGCNRSKIMFISRCFTALTAFQSYKDC